MANEQVNQTVIGSGNIFTGTGDIRINYQLPAAEAEERRVLLQLTENVKQTWIASVLETSVYQELLIELRGESRPDTVTHPWQRVLELNGQPSEVLGVERRIGTVYTQAGQALLILGAPGAGKTVTLLELARELIGRFEKDPKEAAPVVLNLSTWDKRRGSLEMWIESEMNGKYFVPPRRTRAWLRGSRLILLLDGLDEVAPENQSACVLAINRFLQTTGAPGIAVSCRLAEYLSLPERLRFKGAICLQPLVAGEVDQFLQRVGTPLSALRTVMQSDPILQELAGSPLLLNILCLAYRDLPADEIKGLGGETVEVRRHRLFERYAERMFRRIPNPPAEFPEAATRTWLGWLAQRMREHSLTLFSVDQLQPSWLPSRADRWKYAFASRIASAGIWASAWWSLQLLVVPALQAVWLRGFTFVALAGLAAGGIAGFVDGLRLTRPARPFSKTGERLRVFGMIAAQTLLLGILFAAASRWVIPPVDPEVLRQLGVQSGYTAWKADATQGAWAGFALGLVFGLRRMNLHAGADIRLRKALRLSWRSAWKGIKISGGIGMLVGVALAVIVFVGGWSQFENESVLILAVAGGLFVLIAGLFWGLIGGILGMFSNCDLPTKIQPGQWLRRSLQSAAMAGLVVFGVSALVFVPLCFVPGSTWLVGPTVATCGGLGIAAAMWYGGFDLIQHFCLRGLLRRRGSIPNHYVRFLEYSARLIFLQKVGVGFLFIHRQFLGFFADQAAGGGTLPPRETTRGLDPAS